MNALAQPITDGLGQLLVGPGGCGHVGVRRGITECPTSRLGVRGQAFYRQAIACGSLRLRCAAEFAGHPVAQGIRGQWRQSRQVFGRPLLARHGALPRRCHRQERFGSTAKVNAQLGRVLRGLGQGTGCSPIGLGRDGPGAIRCALRALPKAHHTRALPGLGHSLARKRCRSLWRRFDKPELNCRAGHRPSGWQLIAGQGL